MYGVMPKSLTPWLLQSMAEEKPLELTLDGLILPSLCMDTLEVHSTVWTVENINLRCVTFVHAVKYLFSDAKMCYSSLIKET